MLNGLYNYTHYSPSETINKAIEATPEAYLARKPSLMHIKLSDSAVKKLKKAAKKYTLSNATLIERAIYCYYILSTIKKVKDIGSKVDDIIEEGGKPFQGIEKDIDGLLQAVLPFELQTSVSKPHWVLQDNLFTLLALNPSLLRRGSSNDT